MIVVKRDKECVLVRKLCCLVTEYQYGDGKSSVVVRMGQGCVIML